MRSRRRRASLPKPREPRGAQVAYIRGLRRVWGEVQQAVLWGLGPLLDIWPAEERTDEADPPTDHPARRRRTPVPPARRYSPGPFGVPLHRRITDVSDAELRRLWPGLDPDDVRKYAPWATSHEEVYRVAFPAGQEIRQGTGAVIDLQGRVREAIEVERHAQMSRPARPRVPRIRAPGRPPDAFVAVHPVYDHAGRIMLPPRPEVISSLTIERQMAFIRLATHQLVTSENLAPVLGGPAQQTELFATRETSRIIGIDLRREVPGLSHLINAWREQNINLIESGTMAGAASPRMRPSMLSDLSAMVEDAHARGLRVEALAGQIGDRFGVSDRRAELLARDQILKLNAQVTKHRQMQAGVREYTWSTSRDERVRPMHRELEGSTQSWLNPPEVAPGRYEHPGGDYQCRCVSVPIPPRDGGEFDYGL